MNVHYIWIGNNDIPTNYLVNFRNCAALNPQFTFTIWKTNDCLQLVEEHGLTDVFGPLSFIGKCNFLKYLVLHKFGGIYTDFDIAWKQPFAKIMNNYNFPGGSDLVLTSINPGLMDDPFIISKPGVLGSLITFCKNRTNLKSDGELYKKTGRLETHKLEPFGPFGLSEWLVANNINFTFFPQETLLDHNGFLGAHQQKSRWKL
jgi:hypothetical protein